MVSHRHPDRPCRDPRAGLLARRRALVWANRAAKTLHDCRRPPVSLDAGQWACRARRRRPPGLAADERAAPDPARRARPARGLPAHGAGSRRSREGAAAAADAADWRPRIGRAVAIGRHRRRRPSWRAAGDSRAATPSAADPAGAALERAPRPRSAAARVRRRLWPRPSRGFSTKWRREGASFARLGDLVPEELAEHWQIVRRFLEILPQHWPASSPPRARSTPPTAATA